VARLFSRRPDPFWDDGRGARRARLQRRIVRLGVAFIALVLIVLLVTRLPAIDPAFLLTGGGRPILAGALLALLGSSVLLGLARMRHRDLS
jgi:hypothetical protein